MMALGEIFLKTDFSLVIPNELLPQSQAFVFVPGVAVEHQNFALFIGRADFQRMNSRQSSIAIRLDSSVPNLVQVGFIVKLKNPLADWIMALFGHFSVPF